MARILGRAGAGRGAQAPQPRQAPRDVRLHGPLRQVQDRRDLGDGQIHHVPQHHGGALGLGQLGQQRRQLPAGLMARGRVLPPLARIGRVRASSIGPPAPGAAPPTAGCCATRSPRSSAATPAAAAPRSGPARTRPAPGRPAGTPPPTGPPPRPTARTAAARSRTPPPVRLVQGREPGVQVRRQRRGDLRARRVPPALGAGRASSVTVTSVQHRRRPPGCTRRTGQPSQPGRITPVS